MKHVFYIHSQITLLIAKLIIEQLDLNKSDVIFLLNRGIKVKDPDLAAIDVPFESDTKYIPQTRNIVKCFQVLNDVDSFIEEVTGYNNYACYVPQNTIRFLELMINSKKCKFFSIMEEGAASYYKFDEINKEYGAVRGSIWDKIGYRGRIGKKYFYRPDYKNVFGITEESFPGYRDKILLSVDSLRTNAQAEMDNQTILIYDDIIVSHLLNESKILVGVNSFLKEYNDCQVLFYKFHPMHNEDEKRKMRKEMSEQLSMRLVEIEDHVSIEVMAAQSKNLTFIVNLSSLGLYASFFGHKVFSYAVSLKDFEVGPDLLYGKNLNYGEFIKRMPPIFSQKVTFLHDAAMGSHHLCKE
jgi:hypothetical protein